MPEWLIERGIGEVRAALVEGREILEARVTLDGEICAGTVLEARLIDKGRDGRNAVARDPAKRDYLLPRGTGTATEGGTIRIEVTRSAIPGTEPWKRPLARLTDAAIDEAPAIDGREVVFPAPSGTLSDFGWDDLIDQARSGTVTFAGGGLRLSPTPAMTLIDVDGALLPDQLVVVGARAAASAIRRLDIGGSIGIDLPTASGKAARQSAAAAIDSQLPKPFERTAVNGFGFVQIVRPRQRASLLELAADRAGFEARALIRRAALGPSGARRLVAHPAVIAAIEAGPDWIEQVSRQLGGAIGLRADPTLPISAGHADPA